MNWFLTTVEYKLSLAVTLLYAEVKGECARYCLSRGIPTV